MQPATTAVRSALGKSLPGAAVQATNALRSTAPSTAEVPQWFEEVEKQAVADTLEAKRGQQQAAGSEEALPGKGVHYNLYLGADLRMYSSAMAEQKLKNMHEPKHRDLWISKFAARVADVLWPGCQDSVDEAIAQHKVMAAHSRVHVPEPEYEPPSVPHFLPVTNWVRNNEKLRESFVCDSTTRYKPRMAWYNPNDGMVPSGWLTEGLLADLAYYRPFGEMRKPEQAP